MSEDTVNPSVVVPDSILLSLIINGTCGFTMIIAIFFCMGNFDEAITPGPGLLGFPYMYIFKQATNSTAGATVMATVIMVLGACATVSMLASTSRVFWPFARDRGLPFWRILSKVNYRTTVPVWAIAATTTTSVLLSLINVGSPIAFMNVTSLNLLSLRLLPYGCYSASLTTKDFTMPASSDLSDLANTTDAKLVWGPFHIPGAFVVGFFSFWPLVLSPTPALMNYSVLVSGSVAIFSAIYYFLGHPT
ncbi:hypothetical protein IWW34DRAFT_810422 [Fusarium oxysporum f. sp. albedinis]|nr:hypothetical protein IWW34DRAFT_810422 [Fusarium oxysporum f. sp. albedinis]